MYEIAGTQCQSSFTLKSLVTHKFTQTQQHDECQIFMNTTFLV